MVVVFVVVAVVVCLSVCLICFSLSKGRHGFFLDLWNEEKWEVALKQSHRTGVKYTGYVHIPYYSEFH